MHPALGGQRGLKGDTSMPRRRHLCTNGPQPCGSPATNSVGHWASDFRPPFLLYQRAVRADGLKCLLQLVSCP